MIKRIYVPTHGPESWRGLLADPNKQWKAGHSAQTLANCWEAADGWPLEVVALFKSSGVEAFTVVELLLAIPEYKVDLPPRGWPSQNDLFALGKAADGRLVSVVVEGKVNESFGPTLGEWIAGASANKVARLSFLTRTLGLPDTLPPAVRYQLLHRLASALLLARQFDTRYAITLVHSFSPTHRWFEDFEAFCRLFPACDGPSHSLRFLNEIDGISLYAGWASGDPVYLQ